MIATSARVAHLTTQFLLVFEGNTALTERRVSEVIATEEGRSSPTEQDRSTARALVEQARRQLDREALVTV